MTENRPRLEGTKIAILVTNGFEQSEMTEPRRALDEAGATTHLVSPAGDEVKGWQDADWGDAFPVDVALDDASTNDYHALVLPGGVINPDQLRAEPKAVRLVRDFVIAGKPVAAICHGPWLLVEAGVVDGRRMTSYHSIRTDLINAGADWVNEEVVVDGRFVTSRSPNDLPAFNEAMIRCFAAARELVVA